MSPRRRCFTGAGDNHGMEATTGVFDPFPGWDGSTAGARALQAQLAAQVSLEDAFAVPLRTPSAFVGKRPAKTPTLQTARRFAVAHEIEARILGFQRAK